MKKTIAVKVSSKHQIAIPSAARKALNIQAGDRLIVDIQDGLLVLIPEPATYTGYMGGLYKQIWEKASGEIYLAEERGAWEE